MNRLAIILVLLLSPLFLFFYYAKTSKAAGETFTFTAEGDLGGNSRSDATLSALASQNANFNILVGDLSYSEKTPESAWCDYVKTYFPLNYPFELLSGNHEEDAGPDGFIDNFTSCLPDQLSSTGSYGKEYYFDYPQNSPLARFILISADLTINGIKYDYSLSSPRYSWLSQKIDEARNSGIKWVIAGMHKNCITIGEKSCSIGPDLMSLLVEKKVDLVLQGHEHNYQRSKQLAHSPSCLSIPVGSFNSNCVADDGTDNLFTRGLGTIFLITGAGGRSNYEINPNDAEAGYFTTWAGSSTVQINGFSKFVVSSSQINVSFVPSIGTYTDSFSILDSGVSPAPTPTPSPILTETITIPMAEDASIKADSPGTNYGNTTLLEVDNSPVENYLMKFNVAGVNGRHVVSSKIRLYNKNSSNSGGAYSSITSSWSEGTVTWNNAPPSDTSVSSLGSVSSGNWYDLNVSSYITADGTYSLRSASASSDGADYSSSEDVSFAPYLVLIVETDGSSPSPAPSPSPTATPSPAPSPSPTPTPSPTPSPAITITASEDASISLSKPTTNYGSLAKLETDNSPVLNFLLKFPVNSIGTKTVTSAKLRLYNVDSSNKGGDLRRVANNSWSESAITWNTAPPADTTTLASLGSVSTNRWLEMDITPYITGDGTYSFRMTSTSSNGADYTSKEGGANAPQLVITIN